MATATSVPELSAEEKAARETIGGLLDARRNLATVGRDAEITIRKKKDAALKELAKGTTADQLVALAKAATAAIEALDKDQVSIQTARDRVDESLKNIESDSAPCLVSVYTERHDRIKAELDRSADNNKPLKDELKRLSEEISDLTGKRKSSTAS